MKKFVALGNECVEYLKATRASEGNVLFLYFACLECLSLPLCLTFLSSLVNYRCSGDSQCSHFIAGS
jgi:hypothetical protein